MVLCGVSIIGFTSSVLLDVVTRELHAPWLWLQQVTTGFFAWGVFIGMAAAARRNDPAAYDMETIWGHAAQVPLAGNPNPGMWMYGDMLARLARLAPGVLHADLAACNAYAGGMDAAARLKCPVLFVLGARDLMAPPRAAQDLARAIANAKTVTIGASGHSLMAEAPDATLDALVAFVG